VDEVEAKELVKDPHHQPVQYPFRKMAEAAGTARGGGKEEKEKETEIGGNKKRGRIMILKHNKPLKKYRNDFMPRYVKKLI